MAVRFAVIWLLIGVVFVVQLPGTRSQLCPQGWTFHNLTGACMALIRQNYTYFDANLYCQDTFNSSTMKRGGHLVFIFDEATDDFVKGLLGEEGMDSALIGLNDLARNGHYMWGEISPIPANYTGWAVNPHTADNNKRAVVMTKDGWQEYGEYSKAYFVCQVSVDFPTPRMMCPVAEFGLERPEVKCTRDIHQSFSVTGIRLMKTTEVVFSCNASRCRSSQGSKQIVDTVERQGHGRSFSYMLNLKNIRINDATNWTCYVEYNNTGYWVASQPCTFKVYIIPVISDIPDVKDAVEGGQQRVTCMAEGHPAPTVFWQKQGQAAHSNDDIKDSGPTIIDEGGTDREDAEFKRVGKTMEFTSIKPQDAGTYICQAINVVGKASMTIKFEVKYKPYFDTDYNVTTFYGWRGHTANLTCLASANAVATIKWYEIKDNRRVQIENESPYTITSPQIWPDYYLSSSSLLVFVTDETSPVFKDYICEATNSLGSAEQTVTLMGAFAPVISEIPDVKDAVEGGQQRVTCMAEGYPAPTVIWQKQGQAAHTNDDIKYSGPTIIDEGVTDREDAEIKRVGKTMDFTSIKPQDAGTYICQAINVVSNASKTIKFEVRYKPNFDTGYNVTTIYDWRGRTANLTCLTSANEVATIKWYEIKDNRRVQIENESPYTITSPQVWPDYYLSSSSLLVYVTDETSPVFKDYICEATNSLGSAEQTVTLMRPYFPTTRMVCPVAEVELDSPEITCTRDRHQSFSATRVRFMKTAQVVASCDDYNMCNFSREYRKDFKTTKLQRNGITLSWTIKLTNVRITDAGNWTCYMEFDNTGYWVASQPCSLNVYRLPKIDMIPTISPKNPKVGDSEVRITCHATGFPEPTYEFRKGANNITEAYVDEQNGILRFNNLTQEDEGNYTCVAKNRGGSDEKPIYLDVKIAPVISEIPDVKDAVEGGQQRVTCMAEGDPAPVVIWYKEGHPVYTSDAIVDSGPAIIDEGGTDRVGKTMDFTSIKPQDAGTYTCTAINVVGNASKTIKFEVRYVHGIIIITCRASWRRRTCPSTDLGA